ncbi:hypothetical protein OEA41_007504 [Lepraria neglecta]|uniref:Cytochrome P450 n=1 Tax=Lepraria neglecta TaxID=209136 RepID=A0AAD9ZD66_9LECA|nr:hypothetical protein OEA41_007504 [Lepraria neglecta]
MEINYQRASSMGIPLVRIPVDPINIAWILLEPTLWRLLDYLRIDWGTFGRYSRRGWHFHDKAKSHLKYGPAWALVSPRDIYVYVADPDAIHDIFIRRGDFQRPSKMYTSWTDWPRHRKVLATPFNESIMSFVWKESLKQTREMLQSWISSTESGISSVAKDTRTLSLNVLAATGFNQSYKFRSSSQKETNEASTYRDALQTVLDNAIFLMLVPPRLLRLPAIPRSWARLGRAAAEFKQYMVHMLDEEKSLMDRGEKGTGSLMTSFVRALGTHQKEEATAKAKEDQQSKGLTVDEIFGNIFVINFAGHDTTANTLAFSMLLLAANPEVQDWVGEEVREFTVNDHSENWDYTQVFSDLKRCRAVLLETLRLYPPILALPKWTSQHPQTLRMGDRTITIPPHTGVMPSLLTVQTHPKYWQDPLHWQPSRWISHSVASMAEHSEKTDLSTRLHQETLVDHKQSTYFPWSDGPQNCPGAKFAQVEFVAVLACILRDHRVGVMQEPGESAEMAAKRALTTTEDCDLELLLRMRNADNVHLECRRV